MNIQVDKFIGDKRVDYSLYGNIPFSKIVAEYFAKIQTSEEITKYLIREWKAGEIVNTYTITRF